MRLLFWKHKEQTDELDAIALEASKVHQHNIGKIVEAREKVDTLNVVLKQNNIVFQLAHVTGHAK